MWRGFAFGGVDMPFFARGDMKLVVLELLKDKRKHGYEIIKDLEARGGGFYSPSPGAVYPTLQMLEDLRYIRAQSEGIRKVFEITGEGVAYLKQNEQTVREIMARMDQPASGPFRHEMQDIRMEIAELVRLLIGAARRGKFQRPEQLQQVRSVLSRTRKEISDILNI